jgi:hypothetical protein
LPIPECLDSFEDAQREIAGVGLHLRRGFQSGDGSERRYDGEALAKKGIVVVTINYRLGMFGFLALPELTQESPQHASGNYGLLDRTAALQWVHRNISAFGGDPQRVTIAGESAGSMPVSSQMASPLAKGLLAGAIGESGSAIIGMFSLPSLAAAEDTGLEFERSGRAVSGRSASIVSLCFAGAEYTPQDQIGSIAPGKQADFALLDGDVLTVSAEEARDTKVLWTVVGGKTVYGAQP